MRRLLSHIVFWVAVAGGVLFLHWFFGSLIGMPVAALIAASLTTTWLVPRPWRVLVPLALVGELVAITSPLAVTAGVLAPLVLFGLRGRISADISFSYSILIAASAALALALVVGISVYPHFANIPWLTVLAAWVAASIAAIGATLLLPSLASRYLHDRYH